MVAGTVSGALADAHRPSLLEYLDFHLSHPTTSRQPFDLAGTGGLVAGSVAVGLLDSGFLPPGPSLSAINRSRLSSCPASPTTIHEGRIRSASLTARSS